MLSFKPFSANEHVLLMPVPSKKKIVSKRCLANQKRSFWEICSIWENTKSLTVVQAKCHVTSYYHVGSILPQTLRHTDGVGPLRAEKVLTKSTIPRQLTVSDPEWLSPDGLVHIRSTAKVTWGPSQVIQSHVQVQVTADVTCHFVFEADWEKMKSNEPRRQRL